MTALTPQNWVIGNWKLNPYFNEAKQLFSAIAQQYQNQAELQTCHVAIAPPAPYLSFFATQQTLPIVAQDVSTIRGQGAYTGEVSADLLKETAVELVLIGHSERRELFGDDAEKLQQKIKNALQAGLTIVYCVGESLVQREAGQAQSVVIRQLQELADVTHDTEWKNIIIAYEPIWAIGTGKTASPQDAQQMHAAIRVYLQTLTTTANRIPLLYGGSVKPENAVELAACADINGALVGGASLDAASFISIIQAFAQ
ncbi:triose-phosphate isomerase [Acinetobacter qingfengensis]|uniref:Triosephosphate isomerase n=1 Tax=Acinetobacter qingfengensis TaxID=1262585 RepID=A0A1E7RDK8_9GAMM|nr:triose-phosphate isomerase [Acinetobacter qingfengensis]KAA8733704.1 triose-phosphate isomerase [Acinetobacter qingfengensis]OEY97480.1 triose-phosphate isomerase [Acinetobacter qingfengensis]